MLSMKTLKVAIGTLGSAFLLSAGVANAAILADVDGGNDRSALFAAETLGTGTSDTYEVGTAEYFTVTSPPDRLCLDTISAARLSGDDWFIRLDVGDMVLRNTVNQDDDVFVTAHPPRDHDTNAATPDIADLMAPSQGGITAEVVAGGATYNFAIIRLNITTPVPVGSRVRFDLDASLAVMPEPAGPRTVEVNLYDDLSEAIANETSAFGQRIFGGTATLLELVQAVHAPINAGLTATADVATGFTRFLPADTAKILGSVQVMARSKIGEKNIYSSVDGTVVDSSLVIDGATVTLTDGNRDIGDYSLVPWLPAVTAITTRRTSAMAYRFLTRTMRDRCGPRPWKTSDLRPTPCLPQHQLARRLT